MNIYELQEYAEDNGFDNLKFSFTNPLTGKTVDCQWLDAYMGLFKIEGTEGFLTVKQLKDTLGNSLEFTIKKEELC